MIPASRFMIPALVGSSKPSSATPNMPRGKESATDAWTRMALCLLWGEHRRDNLAWLASETLLYQLGQKLPEWTEDQRQCAHLRTRHVNNQWARTLRCQTCNARLGYRPSALAMEAASARAERHGRRSRVTTSRTVARAQLRRGLGPLGAASSETPIHLGVDHELRQATMMGAEAAMQTQSALEQLVGVIGAQTQALSTLTSRMEMQMQGTASMMEQMRQGADALAAQMRLNTETLRQGLTPEWVHLNKTGQPQ